MVILRTGVLLKNHLIPKQERRYQEINEEAPTLISLSIAVGKNGSRPLNHAVRELSPRALARRIVHRVQRTRSPAQSRQSSPWAELRSLLWAAEFSILRQRCAPKWPILAAPVPKTNHFDVISRAWEHHLSNIGTDGIVYALSIILWRLPRNKMSSDCTFFP